MPNKDLQGTRHYCPILDKKISYEYMKKMKSFFDNYDGNGNDEEYVNYGGEQMKGWLDSTLENARDSIYYEKKSQMDAGVENKFKKTHTKDNDNADPTGINLPNIVKGTNHKMIMANKTVYESMDEELNIIKYLMEYMNNIKKNIK